MAAEKIILGASPSGFVTTDFPSLSKSNVSGAVSQQSLSPTQASRSMLIL
jgi:hypothetical protein